MVTCTGPRCSGDRCSEADSIPWWAIHVTLVPSSSVHALEPTGELTVIVVASDLACCDAVEGVEVSWGTVSAAAAAVAAGAGVTVAGAPPVGLALAAAAP